MRIVVNDIAASFGGALTILRQFYDYIKENDHENEWIFLLSGDYLQEQDNIHTVIFNSVKKSGLHKLWFDFIVGEKKIKKLSPDVVLSLQNIITFGLKVPQYVYIHQSIPFQNEKTFSFLKSKERGSAIYQHLIGRVIKLSARMADGVIVQTEWMKGAVSKKARINQEKIIVSRPDTPKLPKADPTIETVLNLFFYPTSNEVYKNNDIIKEACEILNREGISGFQVVMTLPENTVVHPNIKCVGYLQKDELARMYQKATLVFPSYIETVGMPLLEASYYGGRIFASDCPFSKETLSGYLNVSYFSPFDAKQLAEYMRKTIEGEMGTIFYNTNVVKEKSSWGKAVDFIMGC